MKMKWVWILLGVGAVVYLMTRSGMASAAPPLTVGTTGVGGPYRTDLIRINPLRFR